MRSKILESEIELSDGVALFLGHLLEPTLQKVVAKPDRTGSVEVGHLASLDEYPTGRVVDVDGDLGDDNIRRLASR